jgi:hypothetical protein
MSSRRNRSIVASRTVILWVGVGVLVISHRSLEDFALR